MQILILTHRLDLMLTGVLGGGVVEWATRRDNIILFSSETKEKQIYIFLFHFNPPNKE